MKTRTLATVLILICCFVLAPSLLRADENEWYQGRQGQWHRQGNSWRWKSTHGDEWYQGRQGAWYQERKGWEWYGNDGAMYRQGRNGWQWYGQPQKHHRHHD
jgi:hypothetical protein